MKEKLGRWGLVAVVLLALMVLANLNQARTIQMQRMELVAQIKTLIASQNDQVEVHRKMQEMLTEFEAMKTCKSK